MGQQDNSNDNEYLSEQEAPKAGIFNITGNKITINAMKL